MNGYRRTHKNSPRSGARSRLTQVVPNSAIIRNLFHRKPFQLKGQASAADRTVVATSANRVRPYVHAFPLPPSRSAG